MTQSPSTRSTTDRGEVNTSGRLFTAIHTSTLAPILLGKPCNFSVQPTDSTNGQQDSNKHEYLEQIWRRHLNSWLNTIVEKYSRRPCSESKLSAAEKRAPANVIATWFVEHWQRAPRFFIHPMYSACQRPAGRAAVDETLTARP